MPEHVDDFWPEHFATILDDPEPVGLLRQQADLLVSKTGGLVKGIVTEGWHEGLVFYSFYLTAPRLGEAQFKILSIAFPFLGGRVSPFPLTAHDSCANTEKAIANMNEFRDWLKEVLSSKPVGASVGELIRRSTMSWGPESAISSRNA